MSLAVTQEDLLVSYQFREKDHVRKNLIVMLNNVTLWYGITLILLEVYILLLFCSYCT